MPDTTPTPQPFRFIDEDDFCLSARLVFNLPSTLSITIEGSDEPQSAHVPVGDLPKVLAGIAEAAGLAPARQVLGTTDQQPVTAPAGTELRDRIAQAIRDAACTGDGCPDTEEVCVRTRVQPCVWERGVLTEVLGAPEVLADAVLAVLPAPTDRAAADQPADRRDRYAAAIAEADGNDWDTIATQYPDDAVEYRAAAAAVMAVADTEQAALRAEAEGLDEALRGAIAVSEKDGARLRAERDDATHDAAKHGGRYNEACATIDRLRAEVERLRTDRAAVLRAAADAIEAAQHHRDDLVNEALGFLDNNTEQQHHAVHRAGSLLRRMADEAQQPETAKVAPLATPCNICTHTLNWHRNEGGCSVHACYCRSWQQPETEAAESETFREWLGRQHVAGTGTSIRLTTTTPIGQPDTATEAVRCTYCGGNGCDPDDISTNPGPCPECNGAGRTTP